MKLYGRVRIVDSFLDLAVDSWPDSAAYKKAEAAAKNLDCVNDCAEVESH